LPFLICIPLACIIVFSYQQYAGIGSSATATVAAAQTQAALAATQLAGQNALVQTQAADAAANAAATSAAAAQSDQATADALALANAALTQTSEAQAVVVTDTVTVEAPTETATAKATLKPGTFRTATPKTATVTLRECRGDDGTVLFGQALPQSLHAFSSLNFTVAPGTYHLRVTWVQKPQNNVDADVKIDGSQTIAFGDQCQ
jgi:hypothetical protein